MSRQVVVRLGCLVSVALAVLCARRAPAAGALPPQQLIERWSAHLRELADYEFVMDTETLEGKKRVHSTLHVWVRNPELIRIRIDGGSHRGSEIALGRNGRVRARSGGILGVIKVSLSKTDARLRDARGDYAWQSDWGTACRKLQECLRCCGKPECRCLSDGREEICCVYPDPRGHGERREVWTFDSGGTLLLSRDAFEDGVRVEHVTYRDFKGNVGLKESFFDL